MTRPTLLASILGACAGIALAVDVAAATELKFTHVQNPNSVTGQGIEMFAEKVAEYTDGELTVRVYPASQLGNNQENLSSVRTGTVPMGLLTYPLLADIVPEFSVYNAGYFYEDEAAQRRVLDSPELGQAWNAQLLERGGLRIIESTYYGQRNLTTGATPTPVPFSELFQALRQGVVDGQENPLPTIEANKLYEVQNYLMLTGHQLNVLAIVINENAWQQLSPEAQDAMQRAALEAREWITEETKAQEAALAAVLADAGMTVIGPEDGLDVEAFRAAVQKEVAATFDGPKWPDDLVERVLETASGN